MPGIKKRRAEVLLRNGVFGVADSLVSTVGLLAGIDVSGTTRHAIVATGVIYALVEALSMAIGSFLSEESAEEYVSNGNGSSDDRALLGGLMMFLSFAAAAFIPIIPYLFFNLTSALWSSIALSVFALSIVGYFSAKFTHAHAWTQAVRMAVLGGLAIVLGVIVGKAMKA